MIIKRVLIVALAVLLAHCTTTGPKTEVEAPYAKIAQEAIELLNNLKMAYVIQADPAQAMVKLDNKNNYRITYIDPEVEFDPSVYDDAEMETEFQAMDVKIGLESMTLLYNPDTPLLKIAEATQVSYKMKLKEDAQLSDKKLQQAIDSGFKASVVFSAERVVITGMDYSSLLKVTDKNFWEKTRIFLQANDRITYSISGFKLSTGINLADKDPITINSITKKLQMETSGSPDLFLLFVNKRAPIPDFEKLIKQKKPLLLFKGLSEDISIDVMMAEKNLASAVITGGKSTLLFTPNTEQNAFLLKTAGEIKGFQIHIKDDPAVAALSDIKSLGIQFNLDNLSPGLVNGIIDLIKTANENKKKNLSDEENKKIMTAKGMAMAMQLMQSQPTLELSISPLQHQLGFLEAKGNMKISGMGPNLKATVTLFKVKEVIKRIKQSETLPEKTVKTLLTLIKDYLVPQDNGNAQLVFEGNQNQATLNGKPIELD